MVNQADKGVIFGELGKILTGLRDDWEYSGEISLQTGIFGDLQFESIDAVALGSAIEDHFNRSLPFAEFLTKAGERKAKDIYVSDLVDFLAEHLATGAGKRA